MTDHPAAVPANLFEIPEGATDAEKLHLRAGVVIQAAYYVLGDREAKPGAATFSPAAMVEVMGYAIGLMLAADKSLKMPRDVRLTSDELAKFTLEVALQTRESGDQGVAQLLEQLGMTSSPIN